MQLLIDINTGLSLKKTHSLLEDMLSFSTRHAKVPYLDPYMCTNAWFCSYVAASLRTVSSTAVVLKFLIERNSINALHGKVTVGTLILQLLRIVLLDCYLLFAMLPIRGGTSGLLQGVVSMTELKLTIKTCGNFA